MYEPHEGHYPIWDIEVNTTRGKRIVRASTRAGYTAAIRVLCSLYKITELEFLRTGKN